MLYTRNCNYKKKIAMFLVFLREKDKLEQVQMLQEQIVND